MQENEAMTFHGEHNLQVRRCGGATEGFSNDGLLRLVADI